MAAATPPPATTLEHGDHVSHVRHHHGVVHADVGRVAHVDLVDPGALPDVVSDLGL